ncbi:EpsG family protein [Leuconostoc gelidum subsp. gasicomitatum]|uniref:EpsG family protein n=1 Tax=Leuconostoc gasicomitatum TaxID=115778 RepID=UPI001CC40CFF|nr:EpsG family protein [Leuconostoc gasicomitatum]MBZ5961158.1 EpsG family protein [Leuconostoc gasicomitatum]MBZ5993589.1 EpsG family protein [Leuconostoc gasicomitatum]
MVIFLFFFITILILLSFAYRTNNSVIKYDQSYLMYGLFSGMIIFILYLFLLSRQNLFQSDMIAYFNNMQAVKSLTSSYTISEIFNQTVFEKGFIIVQMIVGYMTNNVQTYGLIMYVINLSLPLIAAGYYFGIDSVPFIMLHYMFFNTFNTISLIVVRQGMAIGILLISLVTYLKGKKKIAIVLMILSAQYHSTAYIMLVAFLIIEICKINLKFLLVLWGLTSVLYVTGWNQIIMQHLPFQSQYLLSYTGELWSGQSTLYGQTPNSIKYLAYSAIFLIAILLLRKCFLIADKGMLFFVRVYTMWNTIFLIFGFIAFSSRIAFYSWILFPFIIFYAFWSNEILKKYYPLVLIFWLVAGLGSLPIFGWIVA